MRADRILQFLELENKEERHHHIVDPTFTCPPRGQLPVVKDALDLKTAWVDWGGQEGVRRSSRVYALS